MTVAWFLSSHKTGTCRRYIHATRAGGGCGTVFFLGQIYEGMGEVRGGLQSKMVVGGGGGGEISRVAAWSQANSALWPMTLTLLLRGRGSSESARKDI